MNFIQARLEKENGAYAVVFGSTRLHLSREEIDKAKERGTTPNSTPTKRWHWASGPSTWKMPGSKRPPLWPRPRARTSWTSKRRS